MAFEFNVRQKRESKNIVKLNQDYQKSKEFKYDKSILDFVSTTGYTVNFRN